MEYTKGECGCRIILGQHNETAIEYCPLHKSAPDLYEVCKQTLEITHDPFVEVILMKALAKANKEE